MVNDLIGKIKQKDCRIVVGLDPFLDRFPSELQPKNINDKDEIANNILTFNKAIIDAICDIVPAVKPQAAFYEQYGWQGVKTLAETIDYAKSKNLYIILDGKRNDIGSTASGYARAYLSEDAFDADALTVNGFLGSDGITPFLNTGKMIFVLCKTSNPSSGEIQDVRTEEGLTIYEKMAALCEKWGATSEGYSNCGAVVGATYPKQIEEIRSIAPHTFFLIPGYGAQGGKASDLSKAFDKDGDGAIVNSSRGILYAFAKDNNKDFAAAARQAAIAAKGDVNASI